MTTLSNDKHKTEKIPDFILLNRSIDENKNLQKKVELLEREIIRLTTPKKENSIEKAERLKIKSELIYKQQKDQIHKLNGIIKGLRNTNEELICKLVRLQNSNS